MKTSLLIVALVVCAAFSGLAQASATHQTNAPSIDTTNIVYKANCMKCHGEDGKGETSMGRKLGTRDYTQVYIDEVEAFQYVKHGKKLDNGHVLMHPKEGKLSTSEIKEAVATLKSFKTNSYSYPR